MRFASLALLLLLPSSSAQAAPAAGEASPRHVLAVTLDPAAGTIRGTDELTLPWRKSVDVLLHDGLEVGATCGGHAVELVPAASGEPGMRTLRLPASCKDREGMATLAFTLAGRIVDPVTDEPSLHFVTGDRTSGLVTEEGAFLAGGTGWYPETGDLALYDLSVTVPAGWSVVSQGDATLPEGDAAAPRTYRYVSKVPADGLALSAGPYVVDSVDHEGVRISTWLWAEDRELSPTFLEAAKKEISRLTKLLGAYPGTKFDIVENFFTTGYGFPTYTLLGRDVIRMGPRALRPGYLDHEIAHVWFGNHVNVDLKSGNWCEGLTSYVTNYLNTAAEGEDAALDARRRVSQRYSVDVPKSADFAPAAFTTKSDDVGASVGYGKVSMVFHVLERMLGEETLWSALRDFVKTQGGRRASWDDVRASFERASGRDLKAFFAQWVGRAGLPELALEDVRDEGGSLRGTIVQLGTPYALSLEVQARTASGRVESRTVEVTQARTPFEMKLSERAQRVQLDPAFHVPRRIADVDLPPSLARTLAGRPLLVLHPDPPPLDADEGAVARHAVLVELAKMAAGADGMVLAERDAAQSEIEGSSVLVVGDVVTDRWITDNAGVFAQAAGVDVSNPGSFRAGDRRWRGGTASLLVSAPHPSRPGATITAWAPNFPDALESGRMIFYYGWDTWVALEDGRARARGTAWPERSATSVVLGDLDEPATAAGRMRKTISELLEPRMEGRAAGARAAIAGRAVAERLRVAGVEPFGFQQGEWSEPFAFSVLDLPGRPVFQYRPAGADRPAFAPVVPATDWLPRGRPDEVAQRVGAPEGASRIPIVTKLPRGLVSAGGSKPSFEGLDLANAAAVVIDDGSAGAPERIASWIGEARRRNALALVVLRPDAAWPAEASLVHAASQQDPAKAERLEALVKESGRAALMRMAVAAEARDPDLPSGGDFPLFFAGRELAELLRGASGLARGARSFADAGADLRLSLITDVVEDWNIVGRVAGRSEREQPVVLLSAHHDGLGEAADGTFQQGAADNAAGVAVMVEVARRLAARPADLPVVVVSTSGEEWGLQGSRALVAGWSGSRPAVRAVVNVDTVGHAGKPLHVVGRSREPKLAAIVDAAATAAGLEPGGDIDKHADRDGSDHWPWVLAGVPAIDLFQADYAVINSPKDRADLLDDATLERVADAVEAAVREIASEE